MSFDLLDQQSDGSQMHLSYCAKLNLQEYHRLLILLFLCIFDTGEFYLHSKVKCDERDPDEVV